jgi:hypothetical protein
LVGKVFISCGQRKGREKNIATKVGNLLDKLGFGFYIAVNVQGLNDIMKITDELRSSDYYLFIDFLRKKKCLSRKKEIPLSLFSHQELALAYNLGFEEVIVLKEKGSPMEGFLQYTQSNPEYFGNDEEVLSKVEQLILEHKWNKNYSRNLCVDSLQFVGPLTYSDHTGISQEFVWQVKINNHRLDSAAVDTTCILDSIEVNGVKQPVIDRSKLKWAGQIGYEKTILPKDFGISDIFSIWQGSSGIFLHSAMDVIPRQPIIVNLGVYRLSYKVYSHTFPLLSFVVEVNYQAPLQGNNLGNSVNVRII